MLQDSFWAGLCNLQTVYFKSPEMGTEFGFLCVRHVKTKERGLDYLDDMSKKEQSDGVLTARRPSFSPALLFLMGDVRSENSIRAGKHAPWQPSFYQDLVFSWLDPALFHQKGVKERPRFPYNSGTRMRAKLLWTHLLY